MTMIASNCSFFSLLSTLDRMGFYEFVSFILPFRIPFPLAFINIPKIDQQGFDNILVQWFSTPNCVRTHTKWFGVQLVTITEKTARTLQFHYLFFNRRGFIGCFRREHFCQEKNDFYSTRAKPILHVTTDRRLTPNQFYKRICFFLLDVLCLLLQLDLDSVRINRSFLLLMVSLAKYRRHAKGA